MHYPAPIRHMRVCSRTGPLRWGVRVGENLAAPMTVQPWGCLWRLSCRGPTEQSASRCSGVCRWSGGSVGSVGERTHLSASSCRCRTVSSSQKSWHTSSTTCRFISRSTPSTLMRALSSLPVASSEASSRLSPFTCPTPRPLHHLGSGWSGNERTACGVTHDARATSTTTTVALWGVACALSRPLATQAHLSGLLVLHELQPAHAYPQRRLAASNPHPTSRQRTAAARPIVASTHHRFGPGHHRLGGVPRDASGRLTACAPFG
jgi:hypothetical protein